MEDAIRRAMAEMSDDEREEWTPEFLASCLEAAKSNFHCDAELDDVVARRRAGALDKDAARKEVREIGQVLFNELLVRFGVPPRAAAQLSFALMEAYA